MLKSLNPQDGKGFSKTEISIGPHCWDIESARFAGDTRILRHGAAFKPTIVGHKNGPIVTLGDRRDSVFDAEDHRGEFPEHSKEAKETALLQEFKVTAMTAEVLQKAISKDIVRTMLFH